jgi:hypothetical protein
MGIGENNLFQSSAIYVDYGLSERNNNNYGKGLGLGIIYKNSTSGISHYRTDEFKINIASDAPKIGKEKQGFMIQFPVGISLGYISHSYDWQSLIFSDQLDPGLGIVQTGNGIPTETIEQSKMQYLDIGFGGMIGMKFSKARKKATYISLGFSYNNFPQMNNEIQSQYSLPNKINIHGYYHQPIKDIMLCTGIMYLKQGTLETFIIGGEIIPERHLSFGLWVKNQNFKLQSSNYADLITTITYNHNRYKIGYSYDMTISKLGNKSSRGTHEISLTINLFNDSQRLINKRRQNSTCFFQGLD